MNLEEMMKYVDHTNLKVNCSWEDIVKLCKEAVEYGMASVCIPPCYVEWVKEAYTDKLKICTVVGFPTGYSVKEAKEAEVQKALKDGADEIDMVINLTDIKNRNYEKVENEIKLLKHIIGTKILKVIIETCYLTEDEKETMCRIVTNAHADFIKTSTGFGSMGAVLADIKLFHRCLGKGIKIKAAGGIRTKEDMELFIQAGCDRIGTSSAAALLQQR